MWSYPVLDPVSQAYPEAEGRSPTCYSPVRRSCTPKGLTARLACVRHAASVRPEPGSNSPITNWFIDPRRQTTILAITHLKGTLKTGFKTARALLAYRHTVEFSKNTRTPPHTTHTSSAQNRAKHFVLKLWSDRPLYHGGGSLVRDPRRARFRLPRRGVRGRDALTEVKL